MNGPEHYRRAQELLDRADSWRDFDRWPMPTQERATRQLADATAAQAHAMLALGVVQLGMAHVGDLLPEGEAQAWRAVGAIT